MSRPRLRFALLALLPVLGLPAFALLPVRAVAQDKPATPVQETEEEKKDRETRRACAVALCSTLHLSLIHISEPTRPY